MREEWSWGPARARLLCLGPNFGPLTGLMPVPKKQPQFVSTPHGNPRSTAGSPFLCILCAAEPNPTSLSVSLKLCSMANPTTDTTVYPTVNLTANLTSNAIVMDVIFACAVTMLILSGHGLEHVFRKYAPGLPAPPSQPQYVQERTLAQIQGAGSTRQVLKNTRHV